MPEYKPPKPRVSLIDHEGESFLVCISANKALTKLIPMRDYSELMQDILNVSARLESLLGDAQAKYQFKMGVKNAASQAAESEQ